jgi:hypothetical protein
MNSPLLLCAIADTAQPPQWIPGGKTEMEHVIPFIRRYHEKFPRCASFDGHRAVGDRRPVSVVAEQEVFVQVFGGSQPFGTVRRRTRWLGRGRNK